MSHTLWIISYDSYHLSHMVWVISYKTLLDTSIVFKSKHSSEWVVWTLLLNDCNWNENRIRSSVESVTLSQTLSQTQVTNFELTHGSIQTTIMTSMNFQIKKHATKISKSQNFWLFDFLTRNSKFLPHNLRFQPLNDRFKSYTITDERLRTSQIKMISKILPFENSRILKILAWSRVFMNVQDQGD